MVDALLVLCLGSAALLVTAMLPRVWRGYRTVMAIKDLTVYLRRHMTFGRLQEAYRAGDFRSAFIHKDLRSRSMPGDIVGRRASAPVRRDVSALIV